MVDPESIPKLLAAGTIEVAPLAYMRGRSLNDSFIILDEAQNTSPEQMKMFLTRLGLRLQDRGHRRRHPGRPAQRHPVRAAGGRGASSTTSRTSASAGSPPTTWSGTGWSARSSRPTTSSTRARAASAAADRQAVESTTRMSIEVLNESGQPLDVKQPGRAEPVRAGPDAGAPARRAVHQGRRRGHHGRAQREVDGGRRADRRARLPDGRAAARPGQRGARRRASSAT